MKSHGLHYLEEMQNQLRKTFSFSLRRWVECCYPGWYSGNGLKGDFWFESISLMPFEEEDALQLAHTKICNICVMLFLLKKKKKLTRWCKWELIAQMASPVLDTCASVWTRLLSLMVSEHVTLTSEWKDQAELMGPNILISAVVGRCGQEEKIGDISFCSAVSLSVFWDKSWRVSLSFLEKSL